MDVEHATPLDAADCSENAIGNHRHQPSCIPKLASDILQRIVVEYCLDFADVMNLVFCGSRTLNFLLMHRLRNLRVKSNRIMHRHLSTFFMHFHITRISLLINPYREMFIPKFTWPKTIRHFKLSAGTLQLNDNDSPAIGAIGRVVSSLISFELPDLTELHFIVITMDPTVMENIAKLLVKVSPTLLTLHLQLHYGAVHLLQSIETLPKMNRLKHAHIVLNHCARFSTTTPSYEYHFSRDIVSIVERLLPSSLESLTIHPSSFIQEINGMSLMKAIPTSVRSLILRNMITLTRQEEVQQVCQNIPDSVNKLDLVLNQSSSDEYLTSWHMLPFLPINVAEYSLGSHGWHEDHLPANARFPISIKRLTLEHLPSQHVDWFKSCDLSNIEFLKMIDDPFRSSSIFGTTFYFPSLVELCCTHSNTIIKFSNSNPEQSALSTMFPLLRKLSLSFDNRNDAGNIFKLIPVSVTDLMIISFFPYNLNLDSLVNLRTFTYWDNFTQHRDKISEGIIIDFPITSLPKESLSEIAVYGPLNSPLYVDNHFYNCTRALVGKSCAIRIRDNK